MAMKPEQALAEMQKQNLEMAVRLAQLSIENSQRILQLQVSVASEIFDDGVAGAKSLTQVDSPQQALELRARYAQQSAEKMFVCSRSIAEITAEMQAEMGRLINHQLNQSSQEFFDAMQDVMKGMPLNSHAAAEMLQHTFDMARKTLDDMVNASGQAFSAFTQKAPPKRTARH